MKNKIFIFVIKEFKEMKKIFVIKEFKEMKKYS